MCLAMLACSQATDHELHAAGDQQWTDAWRLQMAAMLQEWGLQPSSRFIELAVQEALDNAEAMMITRLSCSPQV